MTDMPTWKKLVEGDIKLAQEIYDALELIEQYVHHGEIKPEYQKHFADIFRELMTLIPRPTEPMVLYRFLRLNDEQIAAIKAGGYTLEMRDFASWTKSLAAAEIIAKKKQGSGHPVIVKARFSPKEIIVDVADFYVRYGFNNREYMEWERYVRPEQEVVVWHHGPIRLSPANTEILDTVVTVEPPVIGDRFFWHSDTEDSEEISDVDHEQPYADRGIFYVTTEQGSYEPVHKVAGGEWEVIDIEQ